jgi:ABC-type uncharacterized transport system substrate-binding protein
MKKRLICSLLAILVLTAVLTCTLVVSGDDVNNSDKVLKLGYCEGESYYEFDYALYNLIYGLEEYGLIKDLPEGMPVESNSRDIWEWICSQDQEDWDVRFIEEAFFSLTDNEYSKMEDSEIAEYIDRKITESGIDLMISMGTTAGLTTKAVPSGTPMMCFAAADPVKSGIVVNAQQSGTPNVWAQVDVDGFKRTIRVMNDIFKPEKIGTVYADSEEAYIYSGVDVLDEFAQENDIEVVREFVEDPQTNEEYDEYLRNLKYAYEKLAKEVDLFVMTTSLVEGEDFKDILQPFYDAKIPIYSINSTDDVKYGALLAAESADYKNVGRFGADMIKRYIGGERLETLPQVYQTAPFLVINYDVARKIGYKPPFNLLLSANKIYIENSN